MRESRSDKFMRAFRMCPNKIARALSRFVGCVRYCLGSSQRQIEFRKSKRNAVCMSLVVVVGMSSRTDPDDDVVVVVVVGTRRS